MASECKQAQAKSGTPNSISPEAESHEPFFDDGIDHLLQEAETKVLAQEWTVASAIKYMEYWRAKRLKQHAASVAAVRDMASERFPSVFDNTAWGSSLDVMDTTMDATMGDAMGTAADEVEGVALNEPMDEVPDSAMNGPMDDPAIESVLRQAEASRQAEPQLALKTNPTIPAGAASAPPLKVATGSGLRASAPDFVPKVMKFSNPCGTPSHVAKIVNMASDLRSAELLGPKKKNVSAASSEQRKKKNVVFGEDEVREFTS
jgi:hypothetical protein